jgi:hypothetical protein
MKILGTLCGCKLCDGKPAFWYPCGCRVGKECSHRPTHLELDGELYPIERLVTTGGRMADWIYLEPGEDAWRLSARKKGMALHEDYEVIARLPASVHGCYKVRLHQELVIYRKKGGSNNAEGC